MGLGRSTCMSEELYRTVLQNLINAKMCISPDFQQIQLIKKEDNYKKKPVMFPK